MRYKDYIWPHNPRTYSISYERKIAAYKIPFGTYTMQDMGMTYRVLRGEGEFVGEGAYDEFKRLATVFYAGGAGLLVHPVWQTSNAYFVALSMKQQPREDYVSYAFAAPAPGGTDTGASAAGSCTVVAGDTLWGIAARYGKTVEELIALNPQIRNPNLIYPGDVIRIS